MLQCTCILFSGNKGKVLQVSGKQWMRSVLEPRVLHNTFVNRGNISRVLHSSIHNSSVNSIHNTFVDRGIFTTVFTTVLYCQWGDLHNSIVLTSVLSSTVAFLRSGSSWSRCESGDRKPGEDMWHHCVSAVGQCWGKDMGLLLFGNDMAWLEQSLLNILEFCIEFYIAQRSYFHMTWCEKSDSMWRRSPPQAAKRENRRSSWVRASFIVVCTKCYPCFWVLFSD